MTYYKNTLMWENERRLNELAEFRGLIITYFNNSQRHWSNEEPTEQAMATEARVAINRAMDEVHDIIRYSGIDPSITYTPPPMVGGYRQNIDLVRNIFNIHRFQISPQTLLDFIDRAIGVYHRDARAAVFRTINPFFYLKLVFNWIARLPFVLLGNVGFNGKKAEASFLGRISKGLIYLITVLASLLTVLHLVDLLAPAKEMVREMLDLLNT